MKPNEFFNSTENLKELAENNGLLVNEQGLLLYRKALGHLLEFDCSISYNTSKRILNPLGRPVPVITSTEPVVPTRRATPSGTSSRCTHTAMRWASPTL